MAQPVEIRRVPGGTRVDQASKGWGPSQNPGEWRIFVSLTDNPNRTWHRAWEETVSSLPSGSALDQADWEFKPDRQEVEIWVTEATAEAIVLQLDDALEHANARCTELVAAAERKRDAQAQSHDTQRAEATRLQAKLDAL